MESLQVLDVVRCLPRVLFRNWSALAVLPREDVRGYRGRRNQLIWDQRRELRNYTVQRIRRERGLVHCPWDGFEDVLSIDKDWLYTT